MSTVRIAQLESRLIAVADDEKQRWWTNYVKGAQFLGVPMAQVRSIAREWYREVDSGDPVGLCIQLGGHPISEMKLSGIAIMEHELIPEGRMDVNYLPNVREALAAGSYDDWNTCDWLCVKVIGKVVTGATRQQHDDVLEWTSSDVLWEKRAGLVGFVNLLSHSEPSPGFDGAFLSAASNVVVDDRRFAQTAVGWTLRELSHRAPDRVAAFLAEHSTLMSAEGLASAGRTIGRQA